MKEEKVPEGVNLKYSSFDPAKKFNTYTNPTIPVNSKPKGNLKRGPTGWEDDEDDNGSSLNKKGENIINLEKPKMETNTTINQQSDKKQSFNFIKKKNAPDYPDQANNYEYTVENKILSDFLNPTGMRTTLTESEKCDFQQKVLYLKKNYIIENIMNALKVPDVKNSIKVNKALSLIEALAEGNNSEYISLIKDQFDIIEKLKQYNEFNQKIINQIYNKIFKIQNTTKAQAKFSQPQSQKNTQLIELLASEENFHTNSEKDSNNLLSIYENTNISPTKVQPKPSLLESNNLLYEEEDKKSKDTKISSDLFKEMKVKEKKENKISDSNLLRDSNVKNKTQIQQLQNTLKDIYNLNEGEDLFKNAKPINFKVNDKAELGIKKDYVYNDEKMSESPQKSQFDFVNDL